jgi:hypothetical protein
MFYRVIEALLYMAALFTVGNGLRFPTVDALVLIRRLLK